MTGAPLPRGRRRRSSRSRRRGRSTSSASTILAGGGRGAERGAARVGGAGRRRRARARPRRSTPPRSPCSRPPGRRACASRGGPVVALLVTGDEIVDVAAAPGPAQIRNSNGPAVAAQARLAGAAVGASASHPTARTRSRRRCARGLAADVLVVSGGVSAGDYDLVEPALAGARRDAPLHEGGGQARGARSSSARRGETLVFGLPGNPVSAQVTFDLFVRPALLKLQGATRPVAAARGRSSSRAGVRNRSGRTSHVPARRALRGRPARGPAAAVHGLGRPRRPRARQRARGARGRARARPRPARPPRPCCSAASWRTTVRHASVGRRPGPPRPSLSHLGRDGAARMVDVSAQARDRARGRGPRPDPHRPRRHAPRARRAAREGRRRRGGAARRHPGRQAHVRRDPALPPAAAHARGRRAPAAPRRLRDRGPRAHRRAGPAPRWRRSTRWPWRRSPSTTW